MARRSAARALARPDLDETLAALADPTRRGVIDLLRAGPRRAGELAAAFDATPPAMSRHLRVLRRTGLVSEQRDASDNRARVYQLRPERLRDLSSWLGEVERFWNDQLAAFREHAERARTRPARRERRSSGE